MEAKDCNEIKGRLTDVLSEIKEIESIKVKYKGPHPHRWAIIEYEGLGYAVVEYLIYGKELVTGDVLKCWVKLPCGTRDFRVIQEGFITDDEAYTALPDYMDPRVLMGLKRYE